MVCEKSKKVESDIFQNTSSGRETSRFTAKELDDETALYYYGARYMDPRTSRWISTDPALESYVPVAPIDDEAKKHNENLPGMGGVFNPVNLNTYHYAGNNPVKYTDPSGKFAQYAPALAFGPAGWVAFAVASVATLVITEIIASKIDSLLSGAAMNVHDDGGPKAPGQEVIDQIANGHAGTDHAGELWESDPDAIADIINDVIDGDWTQSGELSDDRSFFYDPEENVLVIVDPAHEDGGTVYRPDRGQDYVDDELE